MIAACVAALFALAPQAETPLERADRLWERGERIEALEVLSAALGSAPRDDVLREVLVRRELTVHRYRAALDHAEGLGPELDPERGYCLFRLGRFEEAVDKLDPSRSDQVLLVFDTLELLARHDEARAVLTAAGEALGADHPGVLVRRGRVLADGGDAKGAEAAFRGALEVDPVLLDAWFGLGQSLVRQGRRDEARRALERHRELVPLVDAYDFARKSLDLAPRHAPNLAHLGDVERQLGRREAARASYAKALELAQPAELAPIALRFARLWSEDYNDLGRALGVLDKTFERRPDARLKVRAGDLLLAAGRAAESAQRFREALELRPSDAAIQARLRAAEATEERP